MPGDETVNGPHTGALLAGRRAVITGGSRGLGRAIADCFHEAGAHPTIIDRQEALAQARLPSAWQQAACDLLAPDVERTMADIAASLDAVDIVVANAGVVPPWRRIASLDLAEWEAAFRINVAGVALTLKCFAPALARSRAGSAIVMASLNAHKPHPRQALYSATKFAVLGLARAAALDMGADGTRVNAIAPGPIATDALLSRIDARHAQGGPERQAVLHVLAEETALKRMASARDVAGAALFLASDLSAGISGALLPVDCGIP